jgi:type IV secretion system protein VirB10
MRALLLLALLVQGPRNLQVAPDVDLKPPLVVTTGTAIPVELVNKLSTKNLKDGDSIYARTVYPITVNNQIVIPVGSSVHGKIKEVERPGKVKGKASLTLSCQTLVLPNGVTMPIYGSLGSSDSGNREGEATIKGDSSKGKDVGTAAKAGATGGILGSVFGGGKGAAVGAGGAALGSVLLTRGQDLTLDKGTVIEVVLDQPLEF